MVQVVYPVTTQADTVDNYHGTPVADPYRWLENEDTPETRQWVRQQQELTEQFLGSYHGRKNIRQRLTELWNYAKYSAPVRQADKYFFFYNDGLQNQAALHMQRQLDGTADVILDPNKFSEDGTIALTNYSPSKDARLIAYATSVSGSDWQKIRILDMERHEEYPEVLDWCRFTSIAWKSDNSGFFYSRFPAAGTVADTDRCNYNRVYCHTVGTPQTEDVLVYERPDFKELGFWPSITEDGQYLLLYVYHGTDHKNRIYYRPMHGSGTFIRLLDAADAHYDFIGNVGSVFYFHTNLQAPQGRIVAVDVEKPEARCWCEVVPMKRDAIAGAIMVANHCVIHYLHHAHSRLQIYRLDGKRVREIKLPTMGTVAGLSGQNAHSEMFFDFTSFLVPTMVYRYDFTESKLTVFKKPQHPFPFKNYKTRQVFFTSKDGTKVPMFLTYRKGLKKKGTTPVFLHGYGGFNISKTPEFHADTLFWLEQGGIYALVNLRGGEEYGEEWHAQGMLEKKQNVFDDFIGAAHWLIDNKYTKPSQLVVFGRSNGGLLVGACMTQQPDLFGAVICQNPVIDMLRYHRFTVGRYWIPEYGCAERPQDFRFLYAYSPLHNVKKGIHYPPTLITTADHDDRVVPAHAYKFAATVQENTAGSNPILLRVDAKAGHGAGKPTAKLIEEQSDVYTFILKILEEGGKL